MYRTATKRLLLLRAPSGSNININIKARLRFPFLLHHHHQNIDNNTCRFSSTSEIPQSSPNHTFNPNPNQHSTSTSTAEEARPQETQRKRRYVEYEDEQARVLQASLPHVVRTALFFFFFLMPTMCLINCQREHKWLLLRLKSAHFVIAGEVGMDWCGYDCWCQGSWCFSFYHWFFPKERRCSRRGTFLHRFSINLTFVFPTQLYSGC